MALASVKVRSSGGDVRFLDTVPATVDGALWYEVENGVPLLCLHKGNYDYCYTHDKIRLADNTNDVLVSYLPFDVSTTNDACGNIWTASGSPTIQNGVAVFNGSSKLTNSNLLLGGRDFSVDVWFSSNTQNTWTGPLLIGDLSATNSVENLVFNINGTTWYCTTKYGTNYALINDFTLGRRYHGAIVYSGSAHAVNVFVDGVLKSTINTDISRSTVKINIGESFNGTIDHFRIHDGVALWTENFTPPTATDYL